MAFDCIIEQQGKESSITLQDKDGFIEAEILTVGGILNAFVINVNGIKTNVIDGFNDTIEAQTAMSNAFKSAFLSPFTCRMNHGKYSFNNTNYTIEKFYLQPHAIHGIVFDASYKIINTSISDELVSVTLQHDYEGTDKGYPFTYTIEHQWTLAAKGKLSVSTTITHNNSKSILYAQGWHPYFTLGTSINTCSFQMDSNTLIEFDETLIPTGKKIIDNRFEEPKLLENIFLDNCFELKSTNNPSCKFYNNDLSIEIIPEKNYPFIQVYTPPHRNSIAIENLSGAPDCFNNGMGLIHIEPHTNTIFVTSYVLSKR